MKKNYIKLSYYKIFEYYDRLFKNLKPIIWNKRNVHFLENEEKFTNEKIKFQKILKGKKAAITIIWDDFGVKSSTNSKLDNGGNKKGLLKYLLDLNKNYPYIKTTLFTTPNTGYENYGFYSDDYIKNNKFNISNSNYKEWLNLIKSEKFKEKNEIALHGLEHFQKERKYWPQMEFEFKTEKECLNALKKGLSIFKKIGIENKGFCPPMFGIGYNSNFSLIKALKKIKFNYCCLGTKNFGLNYQIKQVSCLYPSYYQGMLNMPQNISLANTYENIINDIEKIIKVNGFIVIKGHFVQKERLGDGLDDLNYEKLKKVLNYISKYNIYYTNFKELSKIYNN